VFNFDEMPSDGHPMSAALFTTYLVTKLRSEPGIEIVGQKNLELKLRINDVEVTARLDRPYRAYLDAPLTLGSIIQSFVNTLHLLPIPKMDAFADLASLLYPMLKPCAYLDQVAEEGAPPLVARPFVADLLVTLVIDSPRSVAYVSVDQQARWGVSAEALFARALENLARKDTEQVYQVFGEGLETLCVCQMTDGYAATRVLLPQLMGEWQRRVAPRLVLGLPNRDFMIGFSSEHPGREEIAAQIRADAHSRDYPLSGGIFEWRAGELVEYAE
jgi:hypothetical protein